MAWVPVAHLSEVPVGGCHALRVGGCPLALFRPREGALYAVENRCPHEGYPLSTGRVADGRLTCEWHNWKFRLADGGCELGGEDVRVFPVEVRGDQVHVELGEVDPARVWTEQRASLEKAFEEGDFGHAARAVARLLDAGHAPAAILDWATGWAARRMTWGADHGLGAASEYARVLAAGDVEADVVLLDAIHGLVEPNLRRAALAEPASAASLGVEVSASSLRAAIEAEDVARAEAIAVTAPRADVIGWLLDAATDHFLDYGHALLFALSAGELLEHTGEAAAAPMLAAVARGIALGTREDRLPYMRAAMRAFEGPFARLDALWARAHGARPAPLTALVAAAQADRVEPAVDAVTAALEDGADPRHVALALGAAAARRLLDFDAALEHDEAWREGWLDVTHLLTFAEGVHRALERSGGPLLLRGLYQAARFVQHVGPIMGPRPPVGGEPALELARALAERRVDAAPAAVEASLARGAPVEAVLRAASLAGGAVLPIFTAHHVKTTAAALRLSRALTAVFGDREEARWPLMAAARFLAAPLVERRLHRRVRDARRFVRDGRRAPTRLGYS